MSEDIYLLTPNRSLFTECGVQHLTHTQFNNPCGRSSHLNLIKFYHSLLLGVETDLYLDMNKQITYSKH